MKRNQSSWWRSSKVAAVVAAALLGFAPAIPAWATISEVHGMDHWYLGTGDEPTDGEAKVNVVGMTGEEGDTVYLDVLRGSVKIASHLPYTLHASDEDGLVGIVSLDINDYNAEGTYTINVYPDRSESKAIYSGKMSNVYAKFDNGSTVERAAIAARTLGDGEDSRPFELPETIEREGTTYKLTSNTPDDDGDYLYKLADPNIPDEVEGTVEYYTADGTTLRTDTFSISKDEGAKDIPVDNVVQGSDGKYYRSIQTLGYVSAKYPGVTKFSIMCVPLNFDATTGTPFTAKFRYVDASTLPPETDDPANAGTEIGNVGAIGIIDQLIVAGDSSYAPPKMICITKSDGTIETWILDDEAQGKSYTENGTYKLSPSDNAEGAAEQTYNIAYRKADDTTPGVWTVRLIDGSLPANDDNRIIEAYRFNVEPGDKMTYQVVQNLPGTDQFGNELYADQDMVVTTDTLDSYGYTWSSDNLVAQTDIYYVPDNYVEEDSYDVTLNLVNIATGKTIRSSSYEMTPQYITNRSYLTLTPQSDFPDRFEQSGVTYVRLDGQASDIKHSYYNFETDADGNKTKTYTIYYRDVNDDLHANSSVSTVRVVYDGTINTGTVDRGVTSYINYGTTTTGTSTGSGTSGTATLTGTDSGTSSSSTTPTTTLNDDGGLTAITTDNNTTLVRDDGSDVTSERIEDDSNPLAAPPTTGTDEGTKPDAEQKPDAKQTTSAISPAALIGILAVAAAAGIGLFMMLKKKGDSDEEDTF